MFKSDRRKNYLIGVCLFFFQPYEVKVVSLRSHDFTGLGFNICGNMRDGIFIKDVLHRGPASESGKLNAGLWRISRVDRGLPDQIETRKDGGGGI